MNKRLIKKIEGLSKKEKVFLYIGAKQVKNQKYKFDYETCQLVSNGRDCHDCCFNIFVYYNKWNIMCSHDGMRIATVQHYTDYLLSWNFSDEDILEALL